MAMIVTDPRCSVTLAELRTQHTVNDIVLYMDAIGFADDRERME